ncbi:MAG: ScyD/ScyE family protein [Chloroflexota bacterium]
MVVLAIWVAACQPTVGTSVRGFAARDGSGTPAPDPSRLVVVADGLVNPRGLAFGADGALYVAEAGNGGPGEIDLGRKRNHRFGKTGRLTVLDPGAGQRILLDGLPSIVTAAREEVGPSGLAVAAGDLYLLTASGGWDMGDRAYDSGVFRLSRSGSMERILDLTGFNLTSPARARREDPRADVPAGMPYGLAALGQDLYLTDGNHDVVTRVTLDGRASRVLEYPASDRALTGISAGPDGLLYVAEYVPGKITRLSPAGEASEAAGGFALPIGVAFDRSSRMCVLEYAGLVICVSADGTRETVASGLDQATAIVTGPDGDLYVSNHGHQGGDRRGTVVRVSMK